MAVSSEIFLAIWHKSFTIMDARWDLDLDLEQIDKNDLTALISNL